MAQGKKISETEIVKITDPQNSSRRRAVKTIAGGVGALAAYHVLPVNWSKPIVEQVFLPAHAAVSGITLSNPCNVELVSGNQASSIDVIRVSGFVTPPVGGLDVAIAALPNGGTGGQVDVFTTTNADGTYSAEVTMVGGPGIIGVGVGTATAGVGNISGCAIGLPPAQTPQPPTTSAPPTPDFTVTAGTSFTISLFTAVATNPDGTATIGTLAFGNGSSQSVNFAKGAGGPLGPVTYSPGTYTLRWTNSGSTAVDAVLVINPTIQNFNPQSDQTWTLQAT